MSINYKRWQKFFLFCFGLFIAAAFCMKWMEGDFWQGGQKFTIIGLEISYSKEKVAAILAGMDGHVKSILRYHLSFDFAFMAGVYPGIAALCMMAREKSGNSVLKKILIAFALLQIVAWGCDIAENCYLLNWIKNPTIGNEFGPYHFIVAAKWIIALAAALLAIPFAIKKRKQV
ncbi:MAG: hypothetical protein SGI96_06505 [Bacteroidota bacterium]|nr:hypothetical protein [Bacteroidota bacterium]